LYDYYAYNAKSMHPTVQHVQFDLTFPMWRMHQMYCNITCWCSSTKHNQRNFLINTGWHTDKKNKTRRALRKEKKKYLGGENTAFSGRIHQSSCRWHRHGWYNSREV